MHSPALALPSVLESLVDLGFQIDVIDLLRRWPVDKFTVFYRGDERVDWMQPILPIYNSIMVRAEASPWGSQGQVRVATAEGLILSKVIAFRPRDQQDIEDLLAINRDKIQPDRIREEWALLAATEPERTAWLEAMFAKHLPTA